MKDDEDVEIELSDMEDESEKILRRNSQRRHSASFLERTSVPYLSVNDEMDIYPLCIHIDCLAAHGPFCVSSQCRVRLASP